MWSNQYWAKTYWTGIYWTPPLKPQSIPVSGSGTSKVDGKKGWAREREILNLSLKKIQDEELQNIGQKFLESQNARSKKIVEKIIDYSGELEQAKILARELEKLEFEQKKRFINEKIDQEKEKELTLAAKQLKDFLQEEIEILESFMHIEEQNAKMIFGIIGIPVF